MRTMNSNFRQLVKRILWAFAAGSAFVLASAAAHGAVTINMPAPKKPATITQPAKVAPQSAPAPLVQPDVGDIALNRYSNGRTGTYDNYQIGGRYPGYGFPTVWSNWGLGWGWGWGAWDFGFPIIGVCGNRFVGSVGHCGFCPSPIVHSPCLVH